MPRGPTRRRIIREIKSKDPGNLSLEDWLEEMDQVKVAEDEIARKAMTTEELADKAGVVPSTMNKWLKRLNRTGKLGMVRVTRDRIDGRTNAVPAYYMKK